MIAAVARRIEQLAEVSEQLRCVERDLRGILSPEMTNDLAERRARTSAFYVLAASVRTHEADDFCSKLDPFIRGLIELHADLLGVRDRAAILTERHRSRSVG